MSFQGHLSSKSLKSSRFIDFLSVLHKNCTNVMSAFYAGINKSRYLYE